MDSVMLYASYCARIMLPSSLRSDFATMKRQLYTLVSEAMAEQSSVCDSSAESSSSMTFEELPNEVISKIFSYLDEKSRLRHSHVNKRICTLARKIREVQYVHALTVYHVDGRWELRTSGVLLRRGCDLEDYLKRFRCTHFELRVNLAEKWCSSLPLRLVDAHNVTVTTLGSKWSEENLKQLNDFLSLLPSSAELTLNMKQMRKSVEWLEHTLHCLPPLPSVHLRLPTKCSLLAYDAIKSLILNGEDLPAVIIPNGASDFTVAQIEQFIDAWRQRPTTITVRLRVKRVVMRILIEKFKYNVVRKWFVDVKQDGHQLSLDCFPDGR